MIQTWKQGHVPEFMKSTAPQKLTVDEVRTAVSMMSYEGLQLAACGCLVALSECKLTPAQIVDFLDGKEIAGNKFTCFKEPKNASKTA